jgi:thiol-disulfide isomerase/thioredoxin
MQEPVMTPLRIFLGLALGAGMFGLPASIVAQEQAPERFASLEALNASYEKQRHDLECRRIADLADLAGKAKGPEADVAYRQLFGLAIARDLCAESRGAAERCLASTACGRDTRALAALVQVLGRTHEGDDGRALEDWRGLLKGPADAELALAVGEAYLRRLIRDGRYGVARRLCALACEEGAPAEVKDHFSDRMARLALIGKPALPIADDDVDGKPVSLADFAGKVVLVDFWATWCPPCIASIPALDAMARKYHDKGLVILGVNVDAMHEDVQEASKALPVVRRFLIRHRVTWTNLLNGQGAADFASAYGVEQIPANFLVGRDGKVVAVEQDGEALEQAVIRALGGPVK